VFDPGARIVPDRLLSVGLLFVFKGLVCPRKIARTRGPARHAYGGEKPGLSRNPAVSGARCWAPKAL
jgi:hypothetical protein